MHVKVRLHQNKLQAQLNQIIVERKVEVQGGHHTTTVSNRYLNGKQCQMMYILYAISDVL